MPTWLRFLAVYNVAVWLGACVSATLFIQPLFFTPEVTPGLVQKYTAGKLAQLAFGRYFALQVGCGVLTALFLVAERLSTGKPIARARIWVLAGLLVMLGSGFWLLPKMERLHLVKYAVNTGIAQKAAATREFGVWHGISQVGNLLGGIAVAWIFWRTVSPVKLTRFDPVPRRGG
ncbi:MAG: DUF4149 domain-containing protein [Pedosphaera sp.]|nr:DUF4149 domain-containing protein [Pedosphaera sp.]